MKRQSPGTLIFQYTLRACYSHSGRKPRAGRTCGGWFVDWLGVHVSLRSDK